MRQGHGAGTFSNWPVRVRSYAIETTPANILDRASAYGFARPSGLPAAELVTVDGAAHFMIATHAIQMAGLIARHVRRAERLVPAGTAS